MTTDHLPQLDPETFQTFIQGLHADLEERNRIVQSIYARGFVNVLEEHFQLSERQRGVLVEVGAGKQQSGIWNQVLAATMAAGGNIRLVHEGRDSVDIELHANLGPVHIDVSVHC